MNLIKRTIMVFPDFCNMRFIDDLRKKYDPLANKVRPHITLVFPFESILTQNEILEILGNRLSDITPFVIKAHGLSTSSRWLILNLSDGVDVLTKINSILYEHEFYDYKPIWLNMYTPHITVGIFNTTEEAEIAFEQNYFFDHIFTCMIDKVHVEIIGDDEESIIELAFSLS